MSGITLIAPNGTSIQCDTSPPIYPCVRQAYACWNSSSNCFGFIINVSNHSGGILPGQFCNETICPLGTYRQADYDYKPTIAGNSLYIVIFFLILLLQLLAGIRFKTWGFLAGMVGGLILEIVGYAGRIIMNFQPFAKNPFLLYIICLTIGPAFLSGAIYLCLSRVVVVYGEYLSRFRPRTYTITFIACDVISLGLQAVGGALSSTASTQAHLDTGVHVMVAGLSFQVASLLLFMVLCTDLTLRVRNGQSSPKFAYIREGPLFRGFLYALAFATICIFIRCVFRVAELSKGFHGPLANQQVTFMILEGAMIVVASMALTLYHPGRAFGGHWAAASFKIRGTGRRSASIAIMDSDIENKRSESAVREM